MTNNSNHDQATETNEDERKLPGPLYAAAGAGDYAWEKIKEVPQVVSKAGERLHLNERFESAASTVKDRTNQSVDKIRDLDSDQVKAGAREGWKRVSKGAKVAGEATQRTYSTMRERGELKVGRDGVKVISSVAEKVEDDSSAVDGDLVDAEKSAKNQEREAAKSQAEAAKAESEEKRQGSSKS